MSKTYSVESVIGRIPTEVGFLYLIHWSGYPKDDATWEPATALENAIPKLLDKFDKEYPNPHLMIDLRDSRWQTKAYKSAEILKDQPDMSKIELLLHAADLHKSG